MLTALKLAVPLKHIDVCGLRSYSDTQNGKTTEQLSTGLRDLTQLKGSRVAEEFVMCLAVCCIKCIVVVSRLSSLVLLQLSGHRRVLSRATYASPSPIPQHSVVDLLVV